MAFALHNLATTAVEGVDFPFLSHIQQQVSPVPQPAVAPAPQAQAPSAQLSPQPPSSAQGHAQSTPQSWQPQAQQMQHQPDVQHSAQLQVPSNTSQSRSPGPANVNPSIGPNTANGINAHNPSNPNVDPSILPQTAPQPSFPQTQPIQPAPSAAQLQAASQIQAAQLAQSQGFDGSRKRGRPRKYFDEASRRAAEVARRKRAKYGGNPDESDGASESATGGLAPAPRPPTKKEDRRPYLHYQMDYGHYDSSKPDAMTARDVMVNWLGTGRNFADWLEWGMEKRNEVALELREELKSHGMLDRDTVSIKQQITFIQRGCEEAKKYEKEKMEEPLTPFNATKVSYLVSRGLSPGQAYIEHTWPFYPKLKAVAADVNVPMPVSRPPRAPKPELPKGLSRFPPSGLGFDNGGTDFSNMDDALDPALTGAGPSASEVLAVTSWANQLLNQESQRRQTGKSANLPGMDDAESLRILREKEKWELEKLQIRQKLELEKEQMKMKDKNAERDTHIQSILVFRDLLKDGLKRNEAGRIVWRENWDEIKASMDADDN